MREFEYADSRDAVVSCRMAINDAFDRVTSSEEVAQLEKLLSREISCIANDRLCTLLSEEA